MGRREQENRKRRLQLNLASLSIHGSVKYPVKSHQTLTMTVQSAMAAQLKSRLYQITTVLHHTYFRKDNLVLLTGLTM